LAAGVAHELNNPSAAVQRAAEHLQGTLGQLQQAQLTLGRFSASVETLDQLGDMDAAARTAVAKPSELSPVARGDREDEVEGWLESHSVEEGWSLAPSLVSMGYGPGDLQELAGGLPPEQLASVITWLSRSHAVYSVLEEIRHGASRLSEIVGALKSSSYLGQAEVQAVDVNEGVRNTLIILRSKLKQGITLELHLADDLPQIQANGGELNQVWTNLIDNAVDAMQGEGKLIIRSATEEGTGEDSSAEGGQLRIEVEDDGPGIPDEIQKRVFDPFFTTKEPGQGTGLGLNTTYRIVTKQHGGTIRLESKPGCTRFIVRLPLARAETDDDTAAAIAAT